MKKVILIFGWGPTRGLDNNTFTAEKKYAINLSEQQKKKKESLSLHYDGVNRSLFVNGVEIYKFKAKVSEINSEIMFR